jgi:hypothetical protein
MSTDELVDALAALPSSWGQADRSPPVPVELTIVLVDGQAAAVPGDGSGAAGSGGAESPPAEGLAGGSGGTSSGGSGGLAFAPSGSGSSGGGGPVQLPSGSSGVVGDSGRTVLAIMPSSGGSGASGWSSGPGGSGGSGGSGSGGFVLSLSPETAATAIGEHIVIAYDDSIVLVGDNGQLTGNTGDASQGIVALDSQDSTFTARMDPAGGTDGPQGNAATYASTGAGSAAQPGAVSSAPLESGVIPPLDGSVLSDRTVDIAGFEDHSVTVRGQRNVVTYDDSNVFVDRDGLINANTGDTDSGGLNAVDTVRSNVSAGPHCDDGCDDESIIQARAGVFDEGDSSDDEGDEDAEEPEDADEADESESDDGDVSDPAEPPESREEADSGTTPTRPAAPGSLTIGGDGYDNLGVRVEGTDHVVSYDDSNVVVGGTGDVNAQIGDSDTGGTVTMHTVDSEVHGGSSR